MALADLDLLCAAQSASATNETRDEFADRFLDYLRHYAGRYCLLYRLDLTMIDDVADEAIAMVLYGQQAKFDPARGASHRSYLIGLVQNAAKRLARFIHRGGKLRQDWGHPLVVQIHLPTCLEEVPDAHTVPPAEISDEVEQVLTIADETERLLIIRHFFHHETIEEIAVSMGVARTTVSRRLERFYARAAAFIAA